MDRNDEQASGSDLKERPTLEYSVLRALCLTINVPGSTVKDGILDTLTKEDFSLPINRAIYSALWELQNRGEYVVLSNLMGELERTAVEVPDGLSPKDLFRGEPPKLTKVKGWIDRLRERNAGGQSAALASPPKGQPEASAVPPAVPVAPAGAEVSPAPVDRSVVAQKPSGGSTSVQVRPGPELRKHEPEPERQPKVEPTQAEVHEGGPRPSVRGGLSSEADEWATYLQAVAAQQGKILETGFVGLDEAVNGLPPGLMLVVDQDSDRRSDFLKQLTDQIAALSKVPCLFLSHDLSKGALRLRTLSRLSGVPAKEIARGRIEKGSAEWESVEQHGRAAAEWLKWVFIADAESEMDLGQVRDTARQLLDLKKATTCLVVVDTFDKMARRVSLQSVVAGLKEVSRALGILVIAATANKTLLSEPGVDFRATLGEGRGAVQLEFIRAEDSRVALVRLEYRPDIHSLVEQSAS